MSQIALLVCTVLVIFMLRLDRKQAPDVSLASWLPTLWVLSIGSKSIGEWFGMEGADMEAGSPIDRIFLLILLALGMIIILKRKINWPLIFRENVWLMILVSYMFISLFWSDMPAVSFKRWTREIVAIVMVLVLISELNPRRTLECIFRRMTYILIPYSYVLIHYFAHLGRMYGRWSGELMWIGAATHKNTLSQICILSVFFLIWTFYRRLSGKNIAVAWYQNYLEVFMLLLTFYLFGGPDHSLTYSSTATTTLFLSLFCFYILAFLKKRGILPRADIIVIIISVVIVYGTATPFIGKLSLIDVTSTLGRDETLTGRSDIWANCIPLAMERPFFGYGVGGFWTEATREASDAPTAHNGYLEIIMHFGFLGLLIFTAFMLSFSTKAANLCRYDFDWGTFLISFLLMMSVHNITESSIYSFTFILTTVLMFLSFISLNNTI